MHVIEVKDLVKQFPLPGKQKGKLTAVDHISFTVDEGEIFGLLGPNGAGKTTTLEIIESLQKPTSGETLVRGKNSVKHAQDVKRMIGIQLQASSYYDNLSLHETLKLFGSMYGMDVDADKLLEIVELTDKKKAMVKELSGGQQQRFSIATALVNDPEIVFLDEPTTGLDPQARRHLWKFIRKVNEQGKTVVLTTHYMEEAQVLANRVGIIDHGRIVAMDHPEVLIEKLDTTATLTFTLENEMNARDFEEVDGVEEAMKLNEHYQLKITHASEVMPPLMKWAEHKGIRLHNLSVERATLEDVFLSLTGSKLRD